ncbi:MAG TPA: NADH-dependent [FeFe] hydrogenase, group A6 [Bacteroidales bacterium]|nr:NADH-dependent [FeFe] hydrogenase, group A6 [Bacteroidales bacterium]
MSIHIKINGKPAEANKGEYLLDTIERQGIKIPTLCHIKGMFPSGACRMCLVELEGSGKLITSCSYPVEDGMSIFTHSPKVVEARKTIVELLLSNHPDDCLYCARNKNCELQNFADDFNIRLRKTKGNKNDYNLDIAGLSLERDPDKCVLCGRCIRICEETIGVTAIDFINRGSKTIVGTAFNKGLNTSSCVNCGQCLMVCPTGAITEKSHINQVIDAINNPELTVVVQYAPAISVSLAEEFNIKAGKDINGVMNAALRKVGFKKVFDTSFSADLTILEEASELVDRIVNKKPLPMFTSCCPAWVKYVEEFNPELLPNISTCKSPQQMMGSVIKNYYAKVEKLEPKKIYSVSIMPCTAKKFEAQREEMLTDGVADVDAVLTTRELGKLIKIFGIDIANLEPESTDSPLGARTTAGKIFGASGGVMEAALRTAHFMITGKELENNKFLELRGFKDIKEAKIKIGDLEVGIAVVNGLGNVKTILKQIAEGRKDLHFIEVMNCPGGCIAGGGQHIGATHESILARLKALYQIDDNETIRVSHQNPQIIELYKNFLEKPNGKVSHKYLHTTYAKRDVLK